MYDDFEEIFRLLDVQQNYAKKIFNQRDEFRNQALNIPISEFFPNSGNHNTLLDLAYHAVESLFAFLTIMINPEQKYDEFEMKKYNGTATEQILKLIDDVSKQTRNVFNEVDLYDLEGDLRQFRNNEEKFKHQVGILIYHFIEHISQVLKFQGLIIEEIKAEDEP